MSGKGFDGGKLRPWRDRFVRLFRAADAGDVITHEAVAGEMEGSGLNFKNGPSGSAQRAVSDWRRQLRVEHGVTLRLVRGVGWRVGRVRAFSGSGRRAARTLLEREREASRRRMADPERAEVLRRRYIHTSGGYPMTRRGASSGS